MKGEINISTQDMKSNDKKYTNMSNDYIFKEIFNILDVQIVVGTIGKWRYIRRLTNLAMLKYMC